MRKLIPFLVLAVVLMAVLPGNTQSSAAQSPIEARMLVWEFIQGQEDGQLELLTSAGEQEILVNFPSGVFDRQAKHCSQDLWTPGGQGVVLFTGAAEGEIGIYSLSGGETIPLGTTHRMACAGPDTFQLSPNGQRAGYINFDYEVLNQEFPFGNLMFYEAATGSQLAMFDWTVAFKLYDDGALMLRFFPDGKGNATEADVDWWDGSSRRTLTTLEPLYPPDKEDVECGLTNGNVARVGDMAYVFTGQKCEDGSKNWRVVSIPMAGGAASDIALGEPVGGFFPESFTAQLIPTKDESGFLMTVPSGLDRNTVSMVWLTTDGVITPMLEGRHIIADRYGERLTESRHTMVAMDGSAIAFVTVTGNNEQSLWMLDLSTVGGEPVLIEETGAGERIFEYLWAANNTLYFASGSIESGSLMSATPDGNATRLSRGRFFRVATNYNGDKIAGAEWFANPERLGDDLFKITLMNTSGMSGDFKVGGQEHNQLIPLAIE